MRARWISPGVYLNTTQSLHCWALVSSVQWCSTWDPRCTQAWPRTGSTTSLTWQAMKCSCWTLPHNVLLFVNLIWPCFKYVNEECLLAFFPCLLLFPMPTSSLFFGIYNCNTLQLHKCKAGHPSGFSHICPCEITSLVITSLLKSKWG